MNFETFKIRRYFLSRLCAHLRWSNLSNFHLARARNRRRRGRDHHYPRAHQQKPAKVVMGRAL